MKKLNLELRFKEDLTEPQQIVSKFLPHVVGVTSLRLCIKGYTFGYRSMSSKVFLDIAKLPQLEHLIIDNHGSPIEVANFFLTKLVEGCPKLRSVKLSNYFTTIKNNVLNSKAYNIDFLILNFQLI